VLTNANWPPTNATDLDQIFTAVRQQGPVEPSEAGAAPEQLALRTLPAIDHDAVTPGLHYEARMVAVR
jgi:hypothetical protein